MMALLLAASMTLFLQHVFSANVSFYAIIPLVVLLVAQRFRYGVYVYAVALLLYIAVQLDSVFNGIRVLLNEGIVALAKWGQLVPLQETTTADATIIVSLLFVCLFRTYSQATIIATMIVITVVPFAWQVPYPIVAYCLVTASCALVYMKLQQRRTSYTIVALVMTLTLVSLAPPLPLFSAVGDFAKARVHYIQYGQQPNTMFTNGDFSHIEAFEKTATPAFTITMTEPRPLYLKSYVGTDYANGWVVQREAALPYVQVDDALQAFPHTQYAAAANDDVTTIAIEPLQLSKKQLLIPYELAALPSAAQVVDAAIQTSAIFGEEAYTYSVSTTPYYDYRAVASRLYADADAHYLQQEAWHNYRSYAQYVALPQHVRTLLANHFELPAHTSYEQSIAFVKQQMQTISYNEHVHTQSDDVLSSLLEQSKEGYSVHYATLATALFRAIGIPARYVEGYIITNEDITGEQTMTITSDARHAWPEIYIDYIGWMPVEVTPAYAQKMPPLTDTTFAAADAPNTATSPVTTAPPTVTEIKRPDVEDSPTEEGVTSDRPLWLLIIVALVIVLMLAWRFYKRHQRIDVRFMALIDHYNKKQQAQYAPHEAIAAMQLDDATTLYALYNEHRYSGTPLSNEQQQAFRKLVKHVKKQVKQ